jgi:hypothetical protein
MKHFVAWLSGLTGPTHKRTEGRSPVLGFEFTTKAAHYGGDPVEIVAGTNRHFRDLMTGGD